MTTLLDSNPPEDAGASTADRYAFQYCCAASRLLAALSRDRPCELVCEWHEDYLVITDDGTEAVSVKHREDHLASWTTANIVSSGGLAHLFGTFCRGEDIHCLFETNRTPTSGLLDVWSPDSKARKAARDDLADRLGSDRDDFEAFCDNLAVSNPAVPAREHIHMTYAGQFGAPAVDRVGLTGLSSTRALSVACGLVANASRERVSDAAWAAVLSASPQDRAAVMRDEKLEARRVTSEDLRAALTEAEHQQVPTLLTSVEDGPPETTLSKKLEHGGLGPSVVDSATRRRLRWYSHRAAVRDLPNREGELESLGEWVQDQANAAEIETQTATDSYGHEMYANLIERLRDPGALPPGTRPEDRDPSLLAGAAFELADQCTVWFSRRFDVAGADGSDDDQ
jgi:hypothetical protein